MKSFWWRSRQAERDGGHIWLRTKDGAMSLCNGGQDRLERVEQRERNKLKGDGAKLMLHYNLYVHRTSNMHIGSSSRNVIHYTACSLCRAAFAISEWGLIGEPELDPSTHLITINIVKSVQL